MSNYVGVLAVMLILVIGHWLMKKSINKDQEEFKDFWQKHESDPDVAVTFKKDKKNSLFDQDPLS